MLLEGKTAIVTGCNRGIGKAILEVLARNQADVWACARKPDEAYSEQIEILGKETGRKIRPLYFDLTDTDQIKAAVKKIMETDKKVDVLVNNAGIIFTSLFQMTSIAKMKDLFEVNFYSPMLLSQYISKLMSRNKSGSIINISSSAAIDCNEGRTGYSASKAALISASKVMARELGEHNIRVNAIAPGLTKTDMMFESTPEDALRETVETTCLKRVGKPEEIANAVLFLASDLSSYLTGQVIRVDGGM